jgi:RNA-binding protein
MAKTTDTGGLKAHRPRRWNIAMGEIPNHIRREAASKDVKPTVRVGRSGLTEALVEEVDGQLKQRALVKIKVNRGVFDRENLAMLWDALVERTGSVLVLSRGNVGVLWRR